MKSGCHSDAEGLAVIRPEIFLGISEICAGMSTRLGSGRNSDLGMNMSYRVGDDPSVVENNRKKYFSKLGILEEELAVPLQCHSNTVLRADAPGEYKSCDALVTNTKRIALILTIADCVPILLFDPVHRAIGAVHAGWRGTAGAIAARAVEKMKEEYGTNPAHMLAFIGPSAGVCCYEVGEEVAVMFKNKIVSYGERFFFIDLKEENKLQLQQQGIAADNIESSPYCTICKKKLFHSYRRDGQKAGRMIAAVCIVS